MRKLSAGLVTIMIAQFAIVSAFGAQCNDGVAKNITLVCGQKDNVGTTPGSSRNGTLRAQDGLTYGCNCKNPANSKPDVVKRCNTWKLTTYPNAGFCGEQYATYEKITWKISQRMCDGYGYTTNNVKPVAENAGDREKACWRWECTDSTFEMISKTEGCKKKTNPDGSEIVDKPGVGSGGVPEGYCSDYPLNYTRSPEGYVGLDATSFWGCGCSYFKNDTQNRTVILKKAGDKHLVGMKQNTDKATYDKIVERCKPITDPVENFVCRMDATYEMDRKTGKIIDGITGAEKASSSFHYPKICPFPTHSTCNGAIFTDCQPGTSWLATGFEDYPKDVPACVGVPKPTDPMCLKTKPTSEGWEWEWHCPKGTKLLSVGRGCGKPVNRTKIEECTTKLEKFTLEDFKKCLLQ